MGATKEPLESVRVDQSPVDMKQPLESVKVDYYASASKSCQSKVGVVSKLIQPYLDDLQDGFGLRRINFLDLDATGGSFSTDDDTITKWWFAFWEKQPEYWFSCKKSNGESLKETTLVRYMGNAKNQLMKKFVMSRYLKAIEEAYNSAKATLKSMVKETKKTRGTAPKNKVYSTGDIAFILERCLWFNQEKFIDFFVFQTATLRLSSRAAETSRLSVQNLSVCELYEGFPNSILQCYLVRDKNGVDGNHPLIPNKEGLFGDFVAAIGIALFFNDKLLMPSIAALSQESAVSSYYSTTLNTIWKRYPPAANVNVKKGTSHFGKHTAQYQLDGNKLHIAAQLFGGWNVGEGARAAYFSNPFPYLLEGAKALACWPKIGSEYQPVKVPSCDEISVDLGDKICFVFFGHISTNVLSMQARKMILMCVLSKWDKLSDHIRSEPNGLFKDLSKHIIFSTLERRLSAGNVELDEFNKFKSACVDLFTKTNEVLPSKSPPQSLTIFTDSSVAVAVTPPPPPPQEDPEYHVNRFAALLSLVTRNTSPQSDLLKFFTCNFIGAYRSVPKVPMRMQCKYGKIKRAIRVMVRFLDNYPTDKFTEDDANVAANRIKGILVNEATHVKHQGKKPFTATTPICLSIIRSNESLLTDKTKPWYRPLPRNTPYTFIEEVFANKIYDTN